jgi:phage shock protein C
MFAGICGGLGEYWSVDPVALRFLFVVVTLLSGFFPGLIAYVAGIFIIPAVHAR